MAKKIYRLCQPKNTAQFNLTGKTGNVVRYVFTGGNQLLRVPATCVLENEYYQWLLEHSKIFADRIVKIDRVIEDKKEEEKKPEEKKLIAVEEVRSVAQAVDYVANTWGLQAKSGKQALQFANAKGYDFPNMKTKND